MVGKEVVVVVMVVVMRQMWSSALRCLVVWLVGHSRHRTNSHFSMA